MEQSSFCKLSIPTYRFYEKSSEVVLYQIDIYLVSLPPWRIEKRYSDFYDFDTVLADTFQYLPKLPGKSFTTLKEHKDLEKRRLKLENYLKLLSLRMDIMTSAPFALFFDFEQYAQRYIFEPPKLQFQITGFEFTIRDFYFSNDQNLLFLATAQTDTIQQVDAYINNKESTKTPLGSVELWQFQDSKMIRSWIKYLPTQCICLSWNQIAQVLAVGTDKGIIQVYYLQNDVLDNNQCAESQQHQGRINGIYVDSKNNQIHSISKDNYYKIISIEGFQFKYSNYLKEELTALQVCSQRNILVIGSAKGTIFLYDIGQSQPNLITKLIIPLKQTIKSIAIDTMHGFLFAGCEEGSLQVVDIQKPGREIHAKLNINMQTNRKTRQVAFCWQNNHLYVGDSNGLVTFYSSVNGSPIYAFKPHDTFITRVVYVESQKIIFTAAKKSELKIWSLPLNWPNLSELKEQAAIEVRKENLIQMKQNIGQDSDDEEGGLNNWHKK